MARGNIGFYMGKGENNGYFGNCSAFPFTLYRGFFTPKSRLIPPKLKGSLFSSIHWGYKNEEKGQIYPQFQNAVGTLLLQPET